jgi:hypothetical protein
MLWRLQAVSTGYDCGSSAGTGNYPAIRPRDCKLRQARNASDFADRIAESGDYGAALEQTRGALSLLAQWNLLSSGVFPPARDELAEQLEQLGQARLAADLRRSIRERPSLDGLRDALTHAPAVTGATAGAAS